MPAAAWLGLSDAPGEQPGSARSTRGPAVTWPPGSQPAPAPGGTLPWPVRIRQRRCSFPGCRRPAITCDLDHTHPYDKGGRTCECKLIRGLSRL